MELVNIYLTSLFARLSRLTLLCIASQDFIGVVEENPQVGLVAEAADSYPSTSSYAASNGVKMRHKPSVEPTQPESADQNAIRRAQSIEEINKRLSLPADLKLPENFLEKFSTRVSPSLNGPMSRATRRQSLSEIGFGRIDTYTKLDKLGEASSIEIAVAGYVGCTNRLPINPYVLRFVFSILRILH
jgi:hypothetical protein